MPNNIKNLMQAQILETPTEPVEPFISAVDSSTAPSPDSASESLSSPPEALGVAPPQWEIERELREESEAPAPLPVKTIPLTITFVVSVPSSHYLNNIEHETAIVRAHVDNLAFSLGGAFVSLDIK